MEKEKFTPDRLIGLTDGAYAILLTFLFLPLLEHAVPENLEELNQHKSFSLFMREID